MILGILGGGQLGMFSAQAAEKLGIETIIFSPEKDCPAAKYAKDVIVAEYADEDALRHFAESVDVITYEFENIPVKSVEYLKKIKPVYPDSNLLQITQDRIAEKTFLNKIGVETAEWQAIESDFDLGNLSFDTPFILKTVRFGYDGKGQYVVKNSTDLEAIQKKCDLGFPLIKESFVDFTCEISVIVARDKTGNMQTYGPMLNNHKNHILHETIYPAHIDNDLMKRAIAITKQLAQEMALCGVLTLEMFVTKDGRILANEIAPRTHNSGHWSIEGCSVSQFENHVRAVCGMDVLPPEPCHARMVNLIGDEIKDLSPFQNKPDVYIHQYGKNEIKAGRKMGHVTFLEE